jgi:SAM-dependent methyltransferase/protein-tyrosine-phosphatase/quercetin dioxygenase-like cupin family protein
MAEGWARKLKGTEIEAYSAGTHPHGLNPLAVRAMAEAGVDISRHTSKRPEDIEVPFDVVVTVCDSAHEACPVFPGARVVHVGFDDPPRLAQGAKTDEHAMQHYRRVRGEIRRFVETLPGALEGGKAMQSRSCCGDSCCSEETKATHYSRAGLAMRPDVEGAAYWAVGLDRAMLTRFDVNPGARFERHAHDAEQITLVLEGSLIFEFDNQPPITVGRGEVVAIPSGLPHAVRSGPNGADAIDAWSPPREGFAREGPSAAAGSTCSDDVCCSPSLAPSPDSVRESVREGYAAIARGGACGSGGGCCGVAAGAPGAAELARAVGYGDEELAATPDGANMGLSCGNPTALATLRPGEVVLDLGSGGGFDCFIAGPKVGPAGRVIGVDMTPEMVSKARRNAGPYTKQSGLNNVEFRIGEIENLPVADASVDVVLSNCVLNLSPDKPRVWREIARVLKPGGRVAVSDLALLRPLPDSVKTDVQALIGCIAGAVLVEETRTMAAAAGLSDIVLTPKPEYIDAMTEWQDPLYRKIIENLPAGSKASDYITTLDVSARRAR